MACCGQQWAARSPRGRRAAAGTREVTSLGSRANSVSLALRLVGINEGRGGALRDPHPMSSPVVQIDCFGELCGLRKLTFPPDKTLGGFMETHAGWSGGESMGLN